MLLVSLWNLIVNCSKAEDELAWKAEDYAVFRNYVIMVTCSKAHLFPFLYFGGRVCYIVGSYFVYEIPSQTAILNIFVPQPSEYYIPSFSKQETTQE